MVRPKAKELTERELEIMHVFWDRGDSTAAEVRETLARASRDLAYTTVATLIRILDEKGFVKQINQERPFVYRPIRTFDEVSGRMVSDLVERVFRGSSEQLLMKLIDRKHMTAKEREMLESVLRESNDDEQS